MKFHVTVIRSILFSVTLPPLRTNNKLLRWISAFCSRTSKVLALSFSSYDASTKLSVNIPSVPAVINNYERTIVAVIRDENIVKLNCTVGLKLIWKLIQNFAMENILFHP